MRHHKAAELFGDVLGINVDCWDENTSVSVDRIFDEVFEDGYQAGLKDIGVKL